MEGNSFANNTTFSLQKAKKNKKEGRREDVAKKKNRTFALNESEGGGEVSICLRKLLEATLAFVFVVFKGVFFSFIV